MSLYDLIFLHLFDKSYETTMPRGLRTFIAFIFVAIIVISFVSLAFYSIFAVEVGVKKRVIAGILAMWLMLNFLYVIRLTFKK